MTFSAHVVTVQFGGLRAVNGVSMTLDRGEILGIIGPNGAGKTTLLNALTGYASVQSGDVRLGDRSVAGSSPESLASQGVVRSFQATRSFESLTVAEHLRVIPSLTEQLDFAQSLILDLGLEPWLDRRTKDLPYGTLRSLGFALVLMMRPQYLLVDEPSSGLSDDEAGAISEVLVSVAKTGVGIAVIDHNMQFIRSTAERLLVLNAGAEVTTGRTADVLSSEEVRRVYLGTA